MNLILKLHRFFKESFGFIGIFGGLIGGISVANLTIKLFELGFSEVLAKLFSGYRYIFHEVFFGFFEKLFDLSINVIAKDLLVIWLLCAGISVRTANGIRNYYLENWETSRGGGNIENFLFKLDRWTFLSINSIFNMLFWPLAFFRFWYGKKTFKWALGQYEPLTLAPKEYFDRQGRLRPRSYRQYWIEQIVFALVVAALLVVTNAGLP